MDAKPSFTFWKRTMLLSLLTLSSSGCLAQTTRIEAATHVDTSSLPAFILGHWKSIEVKTDQPETAALRYEIVFEEESIVKFIVIYPDGGTEGYTFSYNFVTDDSIFVENERIRGGEKWLLEREDEKLVITRDFDDKTTIIILERVK